MAFNFPAIAPTYAIEKTVESVRAARAMGDGYEKSFSFGLNLHRPSWRISWQLNKANLDTIESFLSLRAADGDSFYWATPDAWVDDVPLVDTLGSLDTIDKSVQRWRCSDWEANQIAANWFSLDATFQQVYEPSSISLPTESSPFYDDTLCEDDIGPYNTRFYWLSTSKLGYGGSAAGAYIDNGPSLRDTDGTTYVVHSWASDVNFTVCLGPVVTRLNNPTGSVSIAWTRQYKCSDQLFPWQGDQTGRLIFDNNNNLWLVYSTSTAQNSPTAGPWKFQIHFLRLSKVNGNILYSKSFSLPSSGINGQTLGVSHVLIDEEGSWYLGGSSSGIGTGGPGVCAYVIKFNQSLEPEWGLRAQGTPNGTSNNGGLQDMFWRSNILYLSISGSFRQTIVKTTVGSSCVKINAQTGTLIYQYPAYRNAPSDYISQVSKFVLDNENNIYIAVRPYSTSGYVFILKLDESTNSVAWFKAFSLTGSSSPFYYDPSLDIYISDYCSDIDIAISSTNRLFFACSIPAPFAGRIESTPVYICEFSTQGEQLSLRKYDSTVNPGWTQSIGFNIFSSGVGSLGTSKFNSSTLLLRKLSGDHLDVGVNLGLFNFPDRVLSSLPVTTPIDIEPSVYISAPVTIQQWAFATDLSVYSCTFNVTAPDRTTTLTGITVP